MIYHVLAAVVAFLAGVGVSAGTFAFILVIGVVPRIMGRMEIKDVVLIENVIVLGVMLGNISSTFALSVLCSPAARYDRRKAFSAVTLSGPMVLAMR